MKKILVVFDGGHFCESSLDFARKLNEISPVLLVGTFLPQVDYANLWSYAEIGKHGGKVIPLLESAEAESVQVNIKRFKSFCHTNQIACTIHTEYFDFALPELRKEARYADIVLVSSEKFFEESGVAEPNDYLKEVMHDLECPILLIPNKYDFPKTNVLAYDGSESSVFAIRQFSYLFPELAKHPTRVVFADEDPLAQMPGHQAVKELVEAHFPQAEWVKLDVSPKKFFSTWLLEQDKAILVTGAYGRWAMSRFFKKSFINDVISDHRVPIFIAHH
ncbi:MAG: hypothetical protein EOO05_02360 [Chitinophagaceae bacterium]|nr:MAG: hypothetical protein EOO05_02360 [Chitinophagaceae bacterium]